MCIYICTKKWHDIINNIKKEDRDMSMVLSQVRGIWQYGFTVVYMTFQYFDYERHLMNIIGETRLTH